MRGAIERVVAVFATIIAAASAGATCDTTTPAVGQVMSCLNVGEEIIAVPSSSTDVVAVVVGGGGGASVCDYPSGFCIAGAGGVARNMTAVMRVPPGTTHVLVTVGNSGSTTPGKGTSAATGGNASSLVALDASGNVLALLLVSGGGGGAGVGTTPSGCTPFGGSSDFNDNYRTYPLYIGYLMSGTGGLVCGYFPTTAGTIFSTGVSIGPTSAGLGGIATNIFQSPPPSFATSTTPQMRSIAWYTNGVWGVDVVRGESGQNMTDVPLGSFAAGGDSYFDPQSGALCSGGGGHGYGGGASGSYTFANGTCSGAGGSGGGWYVNQNQQLYYDSSNWFASGNYGTSGKSGMVQLQFLAPSVSATPTVTPSKTRSVTRSASVSASVSVSATISAPLQTPSTSPSTTASSSATASNSASPSVSPSTAASATVTGSVTASASVSPSTAASATVTGSVTASTSVSPSVSASESVSASASPSLSASVSATHSASLSGSASVSPSVTGSSSVSPSRAASTSASPSRMASVTVSPSLSASVTASSSISTSVSPSATASSSVTGSVSRSQSVSPTQSRTASRSETSSETTTPSGTPSETLTSTETGTATSTATMTVSATATRSSSGTPGVIVPALSLQFTLVGGDEDSLRAGTGTLLRQAVNELVGVDGASSSFTQLVTNYTVSEVQDVYALANATANATRVNSSDILPGSAQTISPNDPELNAPLRRRRLQPGQASCSPITLPANGTLTVPFTTAYMMVQIPPSYFTTNGANTPAQIAALIAQLQSQFYLQLANPGVVTTAMSSFTQAWSTCTGMPDSVGVIAAIAAPAAVNVPTPTPVPRPDTSAMRNGVLIGVITGGLFVLLLVAVAVGCRRQRSLFAANKGAFMFLGGAHECELSQVWDWPVRVPAAGGDANAPAWTIRACPHITLRYTASLALRAAGFELSEELLQGTSLVFKDRTHTVREEGDKPLGDLDINVDTAKDVEGILLLSPAAGASTGAITGTAATSRSAGAGAGAGGSASTAHASAAHVV